MENKMNFLKNGEETFIRIKVIDKDKAFDFIGKHITNRDDCSECGFLIESVFLDKDRFKSYLEEEFIAEVMEEMKRHTEAIDSIKNKLK